MVEPDCAWVVVSGLFWFPKAIVSLRYGIYIFHHYTDHATLLQQVILIVHMQIAPSHFPLPFIFITLPRSERIFLVPIFHIR